MMTAMDWTEYVIRCDIKTVAEAVRVSYETVRRWIKRIDSPTKANLHDFCAHMRNRLAPDEYRDFRASLVADLLGEAENPPWGNK